MTGSETVPISISPLIRQLEKVVKDRPENIAPALIDEIALAVLRALNNELTEVQIALFLHDLYHSELELNPLVLEKCARITFDAAELPDEKALKQVIAERNIKHGGYNGGLCDIVGTGGDHHSSFNVSTASSIIVSALILVGKHGNRAATSLSGSSDVLSHMRTPEQPLLQHVNAQSLPQFYNKTNYTFLYAPNFHKGFAHLIGVRKQIPHPTIFNFLGILANPADVAVEARMNGTKQKHLVPIFAEAFKLHGVKKGLVVCGDEDLDEVSCAGPTHCAWTREKIVSGQAKVEIDYFQITPEHFGLPRHELSEVSPGKTPQENAEIMKRLLTGGMSTDDPIMHFVLLNASAFLNVSGICEGDTSAFGDGAPVITERGPGGGRWKEGVRLARQAIESGKAWDMFKKFTQLTHELDS